MADLITKLEYKKYLGLTTTTKDVEIDLLIPMVSKLVKTYCRRTFVDYYFEPKFEYFDGAGLTHIILEETPINQVVEVARSTDYGQNWTALTEYTDWVSTGYGVRSLDQLRGFYELVNGYRITYTGGYELVPDDLKLAVMDLIEYYMKNNSAVHVNRDIAPNTTQIQYVQSTQFPSHIKRVLDQYVADYT